jgi:hypothetical protein
VGQRRSNRLDEVIVELFARGSLVDVPGFSVFKRLLIEWKSFERYCISCT